MPRLIPLGTLRSRCLQQHDLDVDNGFINANVGVSNALLNLTYGQLWGSVADTGNRYFETSVQYPSGGPNSTVQAGPPGNILAPVPNDLLGVVDTIERIVDSVSGQMKRLRPLRPQERSKWSGKQGRARRYEVVGGFIYLYPTPPQGDVYVLRYIPQAPDLTTYPDTQPVDVVNQAGEDFMIWGFGVRALARVKSDVTLAMAERKAAKESLEEWARLQAFHESQRRVVEDDGDDWFDNPDYDGWYDR